MLTHDSIKRNPPPGWLIASSAYYFFFRFGALGSILDLKTGGV